MWPFRRKAAHVPESSPVQAPEMSERERQYHESNQWGR